MDRCAVLVDAGYVLAAAANVVSGDPGRPGIDSRSIVGNRQLQRVTIVA